MSTRISAPYRNAYGAINGPYTHVVKGFSSINPTMHQTLGARNYGLPLAKPDFRLSWQTLADPSPVEAIFHTMKVSRLPYQLGQQLSRELPIKSPQGIILRTLGH